MSIQFDTTQRRETKVFLENLLKTGCSHEGKKLGLSRSKFIRYAVIEKLIKCGYPLNEITDKFDYFYKWLENKEVNRVMTTYR